MAFASPADSTHVRRGLSKAVMVYEDLRAAIVGLALEPGARIDKHEICARLRVSRQPVAEAVLRARLARLMHNAGLERLADVA